MTDKNFTAISKACNKCGNVKPFEAFSKSPSGKNGIRAVCRECMNAYTAEWGKANPEKVKANNIAYKASEDKEKVKAYNAAWFKANRGRAKENNRAWATANPEKRAAWGAAWRKANPEKVKIIKQNRRARKTEVGGKLSDGLAQKLFKMQKGMCPCCKQPLGSNFHLDHIVPLFLGGTNTDDNVQLLRAICNQQKHVKHPVDFMQSRGFLL